MSELEARKRALIAESEVYRETLKLELQNFGIYALRTRQRLTRVARPSVLVMLAAPVFGMLMRQRRSSTLRQTALGVLSWQLTNRLLPYLTGLLSPNRRATSRPSPNRADRVATR